MTPTAMALSHTSSTNERAVLTQVLQLDNLSLASVLKCRRPIQYSSTVSYACPFGNLGLASCYRGAAPLPRCFAPVKLESCVVSHSLPLQPEYHSPGCVCRVWLWAGAEALLYSHTMIGMRDCLVLKTYTL